jgi:hypothetical protein
MWAGVHLDLVSVLSASTGKTIVLQADDTELRLQAFGDNLYQGDGFVAKVLVDAESKYKEQAAFAALAAQRGRGNNVRQIVPIAVGNGVALMPKLPAIDLTAKLTEVVGTLDGLRRQGLLYFDLKFEHLRQGTSGPVLVDIAELYNDQRIVALAAVGKKDPDSLLAALSADLRDPTQLNLAMKEDRDDLNIAITYWPKGFARRATPRYKRLTFTELNPACLITVKAATTPQQAQDTLEEMNHLNLVLTAWAMALVVEEAAGLENDWGMGDIDSMLPKAQAFARGAKDAFDKKSSPTLGSMV